MLINILILEPIHGNHLTSGGSVVVVVVFVLFLIKNLRLLIELPKYSQQGKHVIRHVVKVVGTTAFKIEIFYCINIEWC